MLQNTLWYQEFYVGMIIIVQWRVCLVLTTGAVLSVEAGASAVTFVVVRSKPHTHSGVLTRVVATRIHCKEEDRIIFKCKKCNFKI